MNDVLNEKNCLRASKFKQRKLNEMKSCRRNIIPSSNYVFKVTIETLEQGVKHVQS